ncbi:hypothetical protein HDU98_006072 [Podochytrium sp. JEL0797]|nr:hypothetical protein HDU98_006072 [Podochytrium sp. JEL0797]
MVDDAGNEIGAVEVPDISISSLSHPFTINSTFIFTLDSANLPVLSALVTKATTTFGAALYGRTFTARFNVPIKAMGITWYSALPLYKTVSVTKPGPSVSNSSMLAILTEVVNFVSAPVNPALTNQLVSMSLPQELISLPLNGTLTPIAAFTALAFQVTETGLTTTISLNLNNPTVISFNGFNSVEFGVQIQGIPITQVKLSQLSLSSGIQSLKFRVDLVLNTSNPSAFVNTLSDSITRLFSGGQGLSVGIVGPIVMDPMTVVQQITQNLQLNVNVTTILSALSLGNSTSGNSFATASLFQDAKLGIELDSSSVKVDAEVQGVQIMAFNLDPLSIAANNATASLVTGLGVVFVNTDAAASALGQAVSPIIASPPLDSAITFANLAIFKDANATTQFAWTQTLFGAGAPPLLIKIPAGTVNLTSILSGSSSMPSLPFAIQNLTIAQLNTSQGFGANGNVALAAVNSNSTLAINLGFGSLNVTANNVTFATALLPSGITISNTSATNSIAVDAQLSLPSNNLALTDPALQAVVNSMTQSNAPPSTVGIGGLLFGVSEQSAIITLSKIQVGISTNVLKNLLKSGKTGLARRGTTSAYATLESASLEVQSASSVSLAADATVTNPTAISVVFGSFQASASLNQQPLGSVELGAINLPPGESKLAIAANATLTSSAGDPVVVQAFDAFVASALAALAQNSGSSPNLNQISVEIAGIAMSMGDPIADVTLFKNVNVVLTLADLLPANNSATVSATIGTSTKRGDIATVNAIMDYSALLPKSSDPVVIFKSFQFRLTSVDLEVAAGGIIQLSAAVGYNNPLPLTLTLPFVSLGFAVDGVADSFTATASNVVLVPGAGSILPSTALAFSNDPKLQTSLAALASAIKAGTATQSKISLSSVTFGGSFANQNLFFSSLDLDISPIASMIKFPANAASALLGVSLPAPLTTLMNAGNGLSSSGYQVGALKVATQAGKAVSLSTTIGMTLPFDAKINIGYLNVGALVGGNQVVNVETSLVSNLGPGGAISFAIDAVLQFQDGAPTQEAVAKLVNNFVAGVPTGSSAGFNAMSIGVSLSDCINAMSQVSLSVPVDSILAPSGPLDVIKLLPAGNSTGLTFQIHGTDISMAAGKQLQVNTLVTVALPFVSSVAIPALSASLAIDDIPMVQSQVSGLSVGGSASTVGVIVAFQDSDAISAKVSSLVQQFNANQPLSGNVVLSGAAFGASQVDLINTFSQVAIPISLQGAYTLMMTVEESLLPIIKLPATLDTLASLLTSKPNSTTTNFHLGSVSFSTQPSKSASLKTTVGIALPFPVSLNLGFVSVGVGVSGNPLVNVQTGLVSNFGQDGLTSIDVNAAMQFSDGMVTQQAVSTLANNFLAGNLTGSSIGINSFSFGVSAQDAITTFSQVSASVSIDAILLPNGPIDVTSLFMAQPSSPSTLTFQLGTTDVTMSSGKQAIINAKATIGLPFVASANIPAIAATVAIDSVPMVTTQINGLNFNNGNAALGVTVGFQDSSAISNKLTSLFAQVMAKESLSSTAVISGVTFGASQNDLVNSFALVTVPIDLNKVDGMVTKALGGGTASSALSSFKFGGANVTTQAGKAFGVQASAGIAGFPITVNIPYSTITAGLDNVDILSSQQSLGVNGATGDIQVSAVATFPSSPTIQDKVSTFANTLITSGVGSNPESFSVSGLQFGVSAAEAVQMFSGIRASMASNTILNNQTFGSMGNLTNGMNVESAGLDLSQANVIAASALVSLGMKLNVGAQFGYIGLDATLDNNIVAQVVVPGTTVESNGNGITVNVNAQVSLQQTPTIQSSVANIANKFLAPGKQTVTPSSVGANNFAIGVSPTDFIDTFAKVNVNLAIDSILQSFQTNQSATPLLNQLQITSTDLSVTSATSLTANFAANVQKLIPSFIKSLTVTCPYIGLLVTLNGQTFVTPAVQGFELTNGIASAATVLTFSQNDALLNQVANALAITVIPSIPPPTANFIPAVLATATGISFGSSASSAFTLASTISLQMDMIATLKTFLSSPSSTASPAITADCHDSGILTSITLATPLLPFPFTNNLGPINLGVSYNINKDPTQLVNDIIKISTTSLSLSTAPSTLTATIHVLDTPTVWSPVVTNILSQSPFLTPFFISGVTIESQTGSPAFTALSNFHISPPAFTASSLVSMKVAKKDFFTFQGLNVQLTASLKNASTLNLEANLGTLSMIMTDASGVIMTSKTQGPITLQPVQEGGQLVNSEIDSHLPLSFALLGATGELKDGTKMKFDISMTAEDGKIGWLSSILGSAPEELSKQLGALFASMI